MTRLARTLALLALALPACTSTYVRLDFTPNPAQSVLADESAPQARVLATVLAAERPGGDAERPFELHLRLRIESLGEQPVTLIEDGLLLLDADLDHYPPPRVELAGGSAAAGPFTVAAGDARSFDLYFPLGSVRPRDLEGLNLRVELRLGDEERVLVGASFERVQELSAVSGYPYYRDPWFTPYPYTRYGVYYGHPFYGW